jgi:hypothetical protein
MTSDDGARQFFEDLAAVPAAYRGDILEAIQTAITAYERTQDPAILDRFMGNLHATMHLLSSPDFVKEYEDISAPKDSRVGVEGWMDRMAAHAGT